MNEHRQAIVLCWLAIFYELESDDIVYSYPPPNDEQLELARELHERAEACYRQATELDPNPELWQLAQVSWCDTTRTPV